MTTSETRGRSKLPHATETEIVKVLIDPQLKQVHFSEIAESRPHLFGENNSELRKRVRNRWYYLSRNQKALLKAKKRCFNDLESPPPTNRSVSSPSPSTFPSPLPYSRLSFPSPQKMTEPGPSHEYVLDIYRPWRNPENILVLIGERSKVDAENAATRINLYVPILDLVDFYQGRFKAYISPDDYGIICLIKPSLPGYMVRRADTIQRSETQAHHEQKIVEQHKVVAASCKKKGNESQLQYRLDLNLPNGMTASNVAYNAKVSGLELNFRLRRVGVEQKVMVPNQNRPDELKEVVVQQAHHFGVIAVVVDNTQVAMEDNKTTTEEADALASILGGKLTFDD